MCEALPFELPSNIYGAQFCQFIPVSRTFGMCPDLRQCFHLRGIVRHSPSAEGPSLLWNGMTPQMTHWLYVHVFLASVSRVIYVSPFVLSFTSLLYVCSRAVSEGTSLKETNQLFFALHSDLLWSTDTDMVLCSSGCAFPLGTMAANKCSYGD